MTELTHDLAEAGWSLSEDGKAISKSYKFKTFRSAMAWMVRAGFEAEAMDHHPEWFNVYNRVDVRLTSHDIDGLSQRDIDLARAMDQI